jgi:hypothetical protein
VSDSAYSSPPQSSRPSQNRPDAEDPQWQRQGEEEEQPGVGQRGQKEEQPGEGEIDQGDDSPLEQSLQLQRSSHCPDARQPNDRVMNILKVILTSTLVVLDGTKVNEHQVVNLESAVYCFAVILQRSWAAWYITRLLIELMPKGVGFFFPSLYYSAEFCLL